MNKKKLANWIIRLSSVAAVAALAGYLGDHSTANSTLTTSSQVEENTDPGLNENIPAQTPPVFNRRGKHGTNNGGFSMQPGTPDTGTHGS